MATTLKDIAEKTGLSPTTISRVLNYDKTLSVSDETRDQIFSVAEKLNYIKSHHRSSSISTKKSPWFNGIQRKKNRMICTI